MVIFKKRSILAWIGVSFCLGLFPVSSVAREVKHVVVEKTGLYEHSNDPTIPRECEKFRPTAGQIKIFFSRAYPVERYVLMHSRYSSCYAVGTIEFSDGHFGRWKLFSGGVAELRFNRGDVVTVFYGKNKWIDPFEGGYEYNGD